jgi:glycosyltransferase involved in cell wall biosynthesis
MRVQFVLESPILTGGARVVYEHARELEARGHSVTLLVPPLRMPGLRSPAVAWRRYLYGRLRGGYLDGLRSYGLERAVVPFDPRDPGVPEGDAVMATAWITAEWVAALPAHAGRKFYLIQQYEVWSEELRNRVEATWKLPLRKIVIAGWLERLARERFGEPAWRIPNGVDPARFHPDGRAEGQPGTVGMLYDPAPWKGAEEGLEALRRVRERIPGVSLLIFGRSRLRHELPPGVRYVRDPSQAEIPGIYRAADVFLSSSRSEGFSLATLEAMASGCALVATAVGEVPEMGRPNEEYVMVPAQDAPAMAAAIVELLVDPDRRRAVAQAGLALARRYTWGRATDRLEEILSNG